MIYSFGISIFYYLLTFFQKTDSNLNSYWWACSEAGKLYAHNNLRKLAAPGRVSESTQGCPLVDNCVATTVFNSCPVRESNSNQFFEAFQFKCNFIDSREETVGIMRMYITINNYCD